MPKVDQTIVGAPCWVDMSLGDLGAAKPFYEALFGWTFTDQGQEYGNYNIIAIGDDVIGGAMQHVPEFMGPDPANAWSMYFATRNAEAALELAVENRGQIVVPAMQVGDQGTMGVASDPAGAVYGLWQPGERQGYDRWGEHGFPGWFELHTREVDTVSPFYATVLGAEIGSDDSSEGMRYHTLNHNGQPTAGIWDITGMLPADAPAVWIVYFIVNDTDAAVSTAKEYGGAVLMGPEDSPHGRMATLQDPSGAVFNVISAD